MAIIFSKHAKGCCIVKAVLNYRPDGKRLPGRPRLRVKKRLEQTLCLIRKGLMVIIRWFAYSITFTYYVTNVAAVHVFKRALTDRIHVSGSIVIRVCQTFDASYTCVSKKNSSLVKKIARL